MDDLLTILIRLAIVGAMVIGGALFAFSTFIMAALKRMPDAEGIRAMQQINKTVFTPWFMGPFFGTTILSLGAILCALMNMDQAWWLQLLGAGLLYAAGLFLVTVVGNVPLNDKLARLDADQSGTADLWRHYLVVWTRWNHVRSVASIGSILLFAESLRLIG